MSHHKKIRARLTGRQEVPPVITQTEGEFFAKKVDSVLIFQLFISRITGLTQAHLHLGAPGVNGPVVAFLYPSSGPAGPLERILIEGDIRSEDLVGPLAGQPLQTLLREIRKGNIYANVHTATNPDGEIRGQLRVKEQCR